ncbi:ABC transporter permease [Aliikangiella coralliicola]|uniref:FtsX-like permease family protein n=1 Tax=Aliikangiella coralliicola TaxID=2592383 RepID=A0A545U6D4_9GAMM|nr:ABC transporter permease [Aliikangiella coralliicola]TQV85032.1 FtsX-like permease family protein [Aliikangiella coralliicola]
MFQYYLKLSWLSIKRTPMLSALMVIAIGLGISVSITVLTVDYLMSKDPLPGKSHKLFHVQLDTYNKGNTDSAPGGLPYQLTYQDLMNLSRSEIPSKQSRSLRSGFSVIPEKVGLTPFSRSARVIDNDFFEMFKVPFLFGSPWEDEVNNKAKKVVVIAKRLNDKLFDGENSVGKTINLDKQLFTIVGVIDTWEPTPRFYDVNNGAFSDTEQLFIPFSLIPVLELPSWGSNNAWKSEVFESYEDKLRSETMWLQYWVQLDTKAKQEEYREFLAGYVEQQRPLGRFEKEDAKTDIKDVVQWMENNRVVSDDNSVLVGLSFMFLAVCMLNTIALLLAKYLKRAPEVGVRRALGASKLEIFTQHIVDVGLIGLAGGALGLLLGQLGLLGVKSLYANYERLVNMDLTLIATAIGLAIGASIIAGLYPAWLICRTNPSIYLKTQ